jgi:hypothetical protein
MEQATSTSSNSSSFEDLAKDNDLKESEDKDFMDILGNDQLTKKVVIVMEQTKK